MKLAAWLKREDLSAAEFGKLIGAKSRATVSRYLDGSRVPDKIFIKKIKHVTHGKVTADSFQ